MDWIPEVRLPILSLAQLLQRLVAALVVFGVHGWVAVALADRLGDPGPRQDGRRTPSPLAHLDVVGLVHALFFLVGWMPRIDVDAQKLRGRWLGALAMTVGASAGLAAFSALLLALRPLVLSALGDSTALTVSGLLNATADLAIVAAVVHLLPLQPFVGAAWAPWAAAPSSVWHGARLRWIVVGVLVVLSLVGLTGRWVAPIASGWRSLLGF
ncbi:MAG: hypothetical protein ABR510_06300 [Trueperaceae bacterium]